MPSMVSRPIKLTNVSLASPPISVSAPLPPVMLKGALARRTIEQAASQTPFVGCLLAPPGYDFEKLDPDNLPWPHNMLAEKKGVRLVATVSDLGTGLLEIKLLEAALKQIRART